jgi:hypothetical protein
MLSPGWLLPDTLCTIVPGRANSATEILAVAAERESPYWEKLMQRVITYVDGFNLYFGLKEMGWRRYYWLNVEHLARSLLVSAQQLVGTKYFTSLVSATPSDPDKNRRQVAFLDVLKTLPDFEIFYGHYLHNSQRCRKCGATWVVPDEKMTDVNIAVELMVDAFQDRFDTALVVSADSDLTAPIEAVRRLFPQKRVVVFFPPGRSSKRLKQAANASFQIWRNVVAQSQLPDPVTTPKGIVIHRPQKWR